MAVEAGSEDFLPNIVHVLVDGFESETLILRLDMQGFGVSGGSACSSHSLEPSHVLCALGVDADRALGALRVSMGRWTSERDVDAFVCALEASLDWSM
ncbi:Cysteine desulfurase [Coriobacteriaceae bacterium CHKCI002]|nr:Cysteine desulfurase [Coriobacteriaceae bacterium CHKCI002]